jgi:hypothetical protein
MGVSLGPEPSDDGVVVLDSQPDADAAASTGAGGSGMPPVGGKGPSAPVVSDAAELQRRLEQMERQLARAKADKARLASEAARARAEADERAAEAARRLAAAPAGGQLVRAPLPEYWAEMGTGEADSVKLVLLPLPGAVGWVGGWVGGC